MKVLIACEFSGAVREEFKKLGHDAWSCDLVDTEVPGNHFTCDIKEVLYQEWDLIIAHPPCTRLTVTGNKWYKQEYRERFPTILEDREKAVEFFMLFANHPCKKICIENPVGIMSTRWKKPTQIIHPWQFGHEASKTTCLWLKGLENLSHTNVVGKGEFVTYKSGKRMTKWYADAASLSPRERESQK